MQQHNSPPVPEGFSFYPEFLEPGEETALLALFHTFEYGAVRMHGVESKRRTAQFGWHYSFESYRLTPARPLPAEFAAIRARTAALARVEPGEFAEALVTGYPPGAGIGWHRDAPPFGIIAGISLGAPSRMRFQRGKGAERVTAAVELPPRSLYLLTGPARAEWQHTIPPVRAERWSLTFRTLRKKR